MSPRTVAVLGGLVQDLVTIADRIPDQGETIVANKFNSSPGGKGANSAVAVYRLSRANPKNQDAAHTTSDDLHVRMIGAVGRDQFGPGLKEAVHRSGVNVDGVQEIEGQSTALGIILIEQKSGENRILLHQNAANAIKPEQFMTPESLGAGVKPDLLIAQLEIRRDTIEQAIETAHHHGIEVLLNPAPACYIDPVLFPMITHLIVNETESKMLSHSTVGSDIPETEWSGITDYFHNLGVQNVVITLGDKGAFYSHENKDTKDRHRGHVDAEKGLKVLDSAGAGDSFVGGYAANYMEQKYNGDWDIHEAVKFGCKAAARVIEHIGCLDPIAWRDEVDIPRSSSGSSSVQGGSVGYDDRSEDP